MSYTSRVGASSARYASLPFKICTFVRTVTGRPSIEAGFCPTAGVGSPLSRFQVTLAELDPAPLPPPARRAAGFLQCLAELRLEVRCLRVRVQEYVDVVATAMLPACRQDGSAAELIAVAVGRVRGHVRFQRGAGLPEQASRGLRQLERLFRRVGSAVHDGISVLMSAQRGDVCSPAAWTGPRQLAPGVDALRPGVQEVFPAGFLQPGADQLSLARARPARADRVVELFRSRLAPPAGATAAQPSSHRPAVSPELASDRGRGETARGTPRPAGCRRTPPPAPASAVRRLDRAS